MEFGIRIPYQGDVSASDIRRVAVAAEEAGFHSGWVGDHIAFPIVTESAHPGTSDGAYQWPTSQDRLDALTTLTYVAAVTQTLRLGVGVLVLGLRPAAQVAKTLASLDVLSDGRLMLGVGLGWLGEEFQMLGRDRRHRRLYLEEGIEIMRTLWEQDQPSFEGETSQFGPVHFGPRPVQRPVPIWFGGHSPAALRRAARSGDGWYGSYLTPEEAAPFLATLETERSAGPRAGEPFSIIISRVVSDVPDDSTNPLPVDRTQLHDAARRYEDAGVDLFVLDAARHDADALLRVIELVAA
jgi:probable F420-dependent oxidoreductase